MLVDYSDSDDEPAAAAAAPPPKKAKKEISLQALHAANNVSAAPSDVPAGLPAGFFDSAADAAADAPPPAAAAASAPKKGLLSFLPPPVNAPKAPAKGGASAYARAQPLKRPSGAAAAASAPGPSAAPRVSAAPDVGAAASVVRPRVDPSLYADAVGAAAAEESVTDAYPGGDDGFTDAYPDAGSYGPAAGGGGGYDVPLGPMAATADDHGAAQRGANSSFLTHMERHMDSHAAGEGGMVSVSQDEMRAAFGPARQYEVPAPPQEVKIAAEFWNRSSGSKESTYQPSRLQKRKHQINSLAAQCAEQRVELEQRMRHGSKSKAQTAAKYGW